MSKGTYVMQYVEIENAIVYDILCTVLHIGGQKHV